MSKNAEGRGGRPVSRRSVLKFSACALPALALPGFVSAQEAPRYGGAFVVGAGTEPRHLNPNIVSDLATKLVANPILNKLVGMARDLTPIPDLARTWTISEDGKTYTFALEEGVLWHDGKPFTSEDVKFTFEKVLFPFHNAGKTISPHVESIEAPNAATIVFKLKHPNDMFLTIVAQQSYIQPKHVYDGTDVMENPANLKPIGTGPFKFSSWTRGQEVVLQRNETYFRKDRPYVDRIVTRFIPEASARVRALEAGEVDYVVYIDLPSSSVASLRANPEFTVVGEGHEAWGSIVELILNNEKAPFGEVKVRQALAHAIDRQFIVEKAYFGLGRVAKSSVSSDLGWPYDPNVKQYDYDPEKAERLLDEAGVARGANGIRFRTSVVVAITFAAGVKAAQIVAEQLAKVGIAVEVESVDPATSAERVYLTRQYDMYIQSLITGPDPAMGMQAQYISGNIRPVPYTNGAGYRNAEVDALFEKAATNADRRQRAVLYKKIQAILAEQVPVVWLYENVPFSAYRSSFGNLHSWAAESIYNYGDVYWKDGSPTRA